MYLLKRTYQKYCHLLAYPYASLLNSEHRARLLSSASTIGLPMERHLDATMQWLLTAFQQNGRGIAMTYSLRDGWTEPYPETTGYAIPTFLQYATEYGHPEFADAALAMGHWLVSIRTEDGGVASPNTPALAFDTAQVLDGLSALARSGLSDSAFFRREASRSFEWLATHQEPDGTWQRHDLNRARHAYSARISSCMLKHWRAFPGEVDPTPAIRNLNYVLAQIQPNGWIRDSNFDPADLRAPILHSIAYTMEGLFDSYKSTGETRFLNATKIIGDALIAKLDEDAVLGGAFDANWKAETDFTCLTGIAQTSLVWAGLFQELREERFLAAARRASQFVNATQRLTASDEGIRGGVAGSEPIHGRYAPYCFPNWAAKYHADALMRLIALSVNPTPPR